MAMNPDAPMPGEATRSRLDQVEWEVVEQVPGDPWTAELVVWAGDSIDGLVVPLDDALMGAIADVRERQGHLEAIDSGALDGDAATPADGDSRAGALWRGLGSTTGFRQADRWLSGVPVRLQIGGAVALLVVFVLVMVIGGLG